MRPRLSAQDSFLEEGLLDQEEEYVSMHIANPPPFHPHQLYERHTLAPWTEKPPGPAACSRLTGSSIQVAPVNRPSVHHSEGELIHPLSQFILTFTQ